MAWLISRELMESCENSRCSPGPAAEYSAVSCSDGERSAPSNSTPTPQAYWLPGRTTDTLPRFRSGMTCAPLTADRGAELLTSFLAGFPVRTYQSQEKAGDSTASDPAYGESLPESLAKFDPATCSWRTRQRSLFEDSTECLQTFARWGSLRNGALWERMPSEHSIPESGCGSSLPTLTVVSCEHPGRMRKKKHQQTCISMELSVRDAWERGGKYSPSHAAWFMGFPISWTSLDPMATDKFQQWLRSHGVSCTNDC